MSLNNFGAPNFSNLSPAMRKMMASSTAAAARISNSDPWSARRAHRGPHYPFSAQRGKTTNILFLSEPVSIKAHQYVTGYKIGKGASFAEKELGALIMDADGNVNPNEPACVALGNPIDYSVFVISELVSYTNSRGEQFQNPVRLLIVKDGSDQSLQLIAQAARKEAGGSLLNCVIEVTRGTGQQTPSIGSSFSLVGKMSREELLADPTWVKMNETLGKINIAEYFRPFSRDEQIESLKRYQAVADKYGIRYDAAAFGIALAGGPISVSSSAVPSKAASSLSAFAKMGDAVEDEEEVAPAPKPSPKQAPKAVEKPQVQEVLDDLDDIWK
jgi:hypothetical protein